ncbi:hypothetical protein B0T16DRAFT_392189 [Cercophora newfieldiana]|uniref:Uncharacterized protein n=1 Tax=Cercophora newfieldiana TaxID=92897 RepID=A0AA39Y2J3_9PEZI|nr:hypothetical protein B0T16DRAFT_392189 [Cercophora newfieldiana]
MSYQEYARFSRRTQDVSSAAPRSRADRPYTGSLSSFSVPRRSPLHSNSSSTSSTSSTSISPSNSASQKLGGLSPTSPVGDPLDTIRQLKQLELGAEKKPNLIEATLPWRPFYLQRRVLACFAVAFVGLSVALEALLGYSTRNQGLVTTSEPGYFVWRLAPTGILLLVAAVWTRVEYQAQHSAPWLRLSQGPVAAEKTLLLDYVSISRPQVIFTALKNRDYVVAASTIVSMFLMVLVVASTGLMFIILVDVPSQSTPITTQTTFVNNGSALASSGSLAFFTMLGLQQQDLLFPDGVSSSFAYQQFLSESPVGNAITATVDGLSAGLECEVARLGLSGVQLGQSSQQFNTTFTAGGCNVTMPLISAAFSRPAGAAANQTLYFARFGEGSCANSPADRRMVVVFGTETFNPRPLPTNSSTANMAVNGTIPRSASLLCKPTYAISQVEVTKRNGVVVAVDPSLNGQQRALANIDAFAIADAFFGSFQNGLADTYADTTPWFYQPAVVNVDPIMYLALEYRLRSAGVAISPDALLDVNILQDVVNDYFQQYVPLLASRSLMEPSSTLITAVATGQSERLVASFAVTQFIVVHLAVAAFLTVAVIFLVPKKGFLPRNPGTMLDVAALIANSRPLLQTLRGTGGGDVAMLKERLAGSEFYTGVEAYEGAGSRGSGWFKIFGTQSSQGSPTYAKATDAVSHPPLLHPLYRMTAFLALVGLVIGLEFTLQTSNKNGGFEDVTDEEHRHVLWTILPASILCVLAFYFIASGFSLRILSPYSALINGAAFEKSISLDLVDKAPPVVLFEAIKSRNLAVGGATAAAFAASLFAMFASTLFTVATVPTTANCQMVIGDFFAQSNGQANPEVCGACQNGTVLASLVLNGNVSYPVFTYEDIAFPSLSLANIPADMRDLPDDIIVSATVPGVRPSLECRSFQQSELAVNLSLSEITGTGNPMIVTLPFTAGGSTLEDNTVVLNTGYTLSDLDDPRKLALDPNALFGRGVYRPVTLDNNETVSRWIWVWGQLENAGTSQTTVRTISALTCNETMNQFSFAVRFVGGVLDIDHINPPIPDESTQVQADIDIVDNLQYDDLVTLPTPHLFDPFFMSLVSSRFAVPANALAEPSSPSVPDAITFQHRLIRAQIINTLSRRPTPTGADPNILTLPARLIATSLDNGAARRVVQDTVSTRILQALLASVLLFSIASWLALPKTNILPRSPTSIASIAALLADGNIFGLLGRGAEWQPNEDLQAYFKDGLHVTMGFQLGWEKLKRRRRDEREAAWGERERDEVFAVFPMVSGM